MAVVYYIFHYGAEQSFAQSPVTKYSSKIYWYVYGLYICMLVYIYICVCVYARTYYCKQQEWTPFVENSSVYLRQDDMRTAHFLQLLHVYKKLRYPHHPNPKKLLRKLIKIGSSPSRIRLHEIHPLQLRLRNYSFECFSRKLMKFKLCKFYPMLI